MNKHQICKCVFMFTPQYVLKVQCFLCVIETIAGLIWNWDFTILLVTVKVSECLIYVQAFYAVAFLSHMPVPWIEAAPNIGLVQLVNFA